MKFKKIGKKGNLPVTFLVMGIFALCGFALLTFFISDFKVSNSFIGPSVVINVSSTADEYLFYKNEGMSYGNLKKIFDITEEYERSYIAENKTNIEGSFLVFGESTRFLHRKFYKYFLLY
ncbi:hypothetical protein J4411_00470 [Candidatus Pacearchaeota archaeon]|nr:hypothetical protein [Candidatus Pacearchaeota archaeon]